MKIFRDAILILVLTLILYGCASNGFLMARPKVTLFGASYPAKEENGKIDVFITTKPTQEYIEFAQITCNDTNDEWSMKQILKKAREIGADGIIIIGKTGSYGTVNSGVVVSQQYGIAAIAIKYK